MYKFSHCVYFPEWSQSLPTNTAGSCNLCNIWATVPHLPAGRKSDQTRWVLESPRKPVWPTGLRTHTQTNYVTHTNKLGAHKPCRTRTNEQVTRLSCGFQKVNGPLGRVCHREDVMCEPGHVLESDPIILPTILSLQRAPSPPPDLSPPLSVYLYWFHKFHNYVQNTTCVINMLDMARCSPNELLWFLQLCGMQEMNLADDRFSGSGRSVCINSRSLFKLILYWHLFWCKTVGYFFSVNWYGHYSIIL